MATRNQLGSQAGQLANFDKSREVPHASWPAQRSRCFQEAASAQGPLAAQGAGGEQVPRAQVAAACRVVSNHLWHRWEAAGCADRVLAYYEATHAKA